MELQGFFHEHPKAALGFSGGVDSSYLLWAARQCGAVEETRKQLALLREREGENCRRMGRVYQALGVTGGAFLMILLL